MRCRGDPCVHHPGAQGCPCGRPVAPPRVDARHDRAAEFALDVAEVDMQMHMLLKPLADEALSLDYEEERDTGTFSLAPAIGMYTA